MVKSAIVCAVAALLGAGMASAAGPNLLDLIGGEAVGAAVARSAPRGWKARRPVRVEHAAPEEGEPAVVTNVVEKVVEKVVTNVVERVVEVEKVVTNVVERVVEVERPATNDAPAVSATNDAAAVSSTNRAAKARSAKITSRSTYYDRKEGFAVFTGRVYVDDEQYQMHADKAYVFFEGTNQLKRLVAVGGVALTNGTRRAYGAKASYYKASGMVVLYGAADAPAEVRDEAKEQDQSVKGERIKFWIGAEQVEVLDAQIRAPVGGAGGLGDLGGLGGLGKQLDKRREGEPK